MRNLNLSEEALQCGQWNVLSVIEIRNTYGFIFYIRLRHNSPDSNSNIWIPTKENVINLTFKQKSELVIQQSGLKTHKMYKETDFNIKNNVYFT